MSDALICSNSFYNSYPESGYWQQFGEEMASVRISSLITSMETGASGTGNAQMIREVKRRQSIKHGCKPSNQCLSNYGTKIASCGEPRIKFCHGEKSVKS